MSKHPGLYTALLLLGCLVTTTQAAGIDSKAKLGEQLFFDPNLSLNRSQSCATCHNPAAGFSDQRGYDANTDNNAPNQAARNAASLGADNQSLGDRNAPSANYASQIPTFHRNPKGEYIGGQFWDGRASSLADQAAGPPLNPIEMGMPDKVSVVARLQEKPSYVSAFKQLFNDTIFKNADSAYAAMADSIAAFERTETFAPFDSKYDRYLRGEYKPNKQEDLGMTLFFSQQFSNCNVCHQLKTRPLAAGETFSNYQYHNIGVPTNTALRALNGIDPEHQDLGLAEQVDDPSNRGKFKVPSLRNVAVTAPYMHNGVFQDLTTVVHFYNKYNSRSAKNQTNPETGELWRAPEVPENISLEELETGPALTSKRINALVAFLKMLTDQRYEHLLEQPTNSERTASNTKKATATAPASTQ